MDDKIRSLIARFPAAIKLPEVKHGEFSIQAQRRFSELRGATAYAVIVNPNIVQRSGTVYVEAISFPGLNLRLEDKTGITDPLIRSSDDLKRFGRYMAAFEVTDQLEPRIYLRSEVVRNAPPEDVAAAIVLETDAFPILCGNLLYLERIDETAR